MAIILAGTGLVLNKVAGGEEKKKKKKKEKGKRKTN